MSSKPFQLGRGLSSLIQPKADKTVTTAGANFWGGSTDAKASVPSNEVVHQLPLKTIKPNPKQPRQFFDHQGLEDLISSIKQHGILQPLVVSPRSDGLYDLIAGERRWRASEIAGLKTIPAIIRQAKEQERLELALVENIQRQNLNPLEEAQAFTQLQIEFNLTQDEIAKRVGKSRSQVANTMRLLTLPPSIKEALWNGAITMGHAKIILGLATPAEQEKFFRTIEKEGLSVHLAEMKAKPVTVHSHVRKSPNPEIKLLENQLQTVLGTRVKIRERGGKGSVEIAFYSGEELKQLLERLKS